MNIYPKSCSLWSVLVLLWEQCWLWIPPIKRYLWHTGVLWELLSLCMGLVWTGVKLKIIGDENGTKILSFFHLLSASQPNSHLLGTGSLIWWMFWLSAAIRVVELAGQLSQCSCLNASDHWDAICLRGCRRCLGPIIVGNFAYCTFLLTGKNHSAH